MPQSESNLGGARFIPPLKRQGFSAPAPDNPKGVRPETGPRCPRTCGPAWRHKGYKGVRLALAEAEALRPDDLTVWENGDFGQREPEVVPAPTGLMAPGR